MEFQKLKAFFKWCTIINVALFMFSWSAPIEWSTLNVSA